MKGVVRGRAMTEAGSGEAVAEGEAMTGAAEDGAAPVNNEAMTGAAEVDAATAVLAPLPGYRALGVFSMMAPLIEDNRRTKCRIQVTADLIMASWLGDTLPRRIGSA
jgi:hypothetical protein